MIDSELEREREKAREREIRAFKEFSTKLPQNLRKVKLPSDPSIDQNDIGSRSLFVEGFDIPAEPKVRDQLVDNTFLQ